MKGDRWKVVPNNIPAESGRINSNTTWKMGNLSLLYATYFEVKEYV